MSTNFTLPSPLPSPLPLTGPDDLPALVAACHALATHLHPVPIRPVAPVPAPWKEGNLHLPAAGDVARVAWDIQFIRDTIKHFNPGARLARIVVVSTEASRVVHGNGIRNYDRYEMYRSMLGAGEPVPPILVEPNGDQWRIPDGNHRTHAARSLGVPALLGLVLTS